MYSGVFLSNYVARFLSSHEIFSFEHESVYSFLCVWVCARVCMQDKHATYLFLQAVWSTFILSVHVAAVYWM